MTRLRKKRLLLLAKHGGDHKRWYSQYCELIKEDLVTWQLGFAALTWEGRIELWELEQDERIMGRKVSSENSGWWL